MKINFSQEEWAAIADALEDYVSMDVVNSDRQEFLLSICERIDYYLDK